MEKTLEEKVPTEEQGGIGRRLRDRELLKKRKAEAEERATNQAQSSKRAKRETNNVPRKKGRPRKNVPVKEPQPETIEAQEAGERVTQSPVEEMLPVPVPVSTLNSASIPAPMPAPALELPQIPAVVSASVPLPVPDVTPEMKPSSEAFPQEVLIEVLGQDEEEDKVLPRNQLVIDQGGVEETSAIEVGEQNKVFSDTVLALPQPDALPGNFI